jgi:hypothetical protein
LRRRRGRRTENGRDKDLGNYVQEEEEEEEEKMKRRRQ